MRGKYGAENMAFLSSVRSSHPKAGRDGGQLRTVAAGMMDRGGMEQEAASQATHKSRGPAALPPSGLSPAPLPHWVSDWESFLELELNLEAKPLWADTSKSNLILSMKT